MNKILIVGHPASGYRDVEALLHECGMQAPQPSRREGLLPHDITATLCKAHKLPPVDTVTEEEALAPIQAGAVWHGMALDLMLGNLDQALWGWADPQAIYALDYWKDLDPKLTFVLVYDEPHRVLAEAANASNGPPSAQARQHLLSNWLAYNGALLRFQLQNPERGLLVHAQQARRAVGSYLQPLLDTPLMDPAVPLGLQSGVERSPDERGATTAATPLQAELVQAVTVVGVTAQQAATQMDVGAAERYLVDDVLAQEPAALQLYADLQSAANLPFDGPSQPRGSAAAAWEALVRQRSFVSGLMVQLHAEYARVNEAWVQAREQLAQSNAAHALQLSLAQQQFAAAQTILEGERRSAIPARTDAQLRLDADAERATAEQLGTFAKNQELTKENALLLFQLQQMQGELERRHLRIQALEYAGRQAAPGEALAGASHVPTARLLNVSTQSNDDLAADSECAAKAHTAQSAAHNQALKVLNEENGLLLSQLHQVELELGRCLLENKRLKGAISPPKPTTPYGAADRVKRQLSYRLGAIMVSRSRSLSGWLGMPWALVAEGRKFEKERNQRPPQKLPPIHVYGDAHKAERTKQHLSYRLGRTLLENTRSPAGWLVLPFSLNNEIKKFRKERKEHAG